MAGVTDPWVPAIHFLSDYGTADEFAGVVRAVLHRQAPGTPIIDLTHHVPHFDVAAGAAALVRAAPYLGPGAVLAVVDPGVGTSRRGVAIRVGAPSGDPGGGKDTSSGRPEWWVGPDNGLLVPAVESVGGAVAVHVLASKPGSTFDGRDVFAPASAHLVGGGDPALLGE
ncbi:MAG TPA: SAM-dependent chlorinase/fluorinase, partial [Acidimicrobiales bacterium]|nr:SAM-dependent chlorinase/fluorinase [Acidimicrobiales bacterium]